MYGKQQNGCIMIKGVKEMEKDSFGMIYYVNYFNKYIGLCKKFIMI